MKALVLAGGAGTRLRPLTHTSAKQLVPVANKPVLFYGLEAIAEAGIREVGIVVGDTAADIRAAVGDGSQFGLEVTYLPQSAPLGLAHCVLIAREYLGDEDFVMYLGDNFIVGGIRSFVQAFREGDYNAQILLTQVADPTQFGVAQLDADGTVIALEEKPLAPKSDLALVGVYIFDRGIHDAVQRISPSARGELEITDAIAQLIESGRDVRSHRITGYWKDTGRVEDMLECNRTVLEHVETRIEGEVDADSELIGRVVVGEGAKVVRSRILGPAIIGAGTTVSDTYIGPFTSVGENCHLQDAEVEYSIVMADSRICGVGRIAGSLVGRSVTVTPAIGQRTHQLILGDHSRVQIHS